MAQGLPVYLPVRRERPPLLLALWRRPRPVGAVSAAAAPCGSNDRRAESPALRTYPLRQSARGCRCGPAMCGSGSSSGRPPSEVREKREEEIEIYDRGTQVAMAKVEEGGRGVGGHF